MKRITLRIRRTQTAGGAIGPAIGSAGGAAELVDYELEFEEGGNMTLLDALELLRGSREPGLRYRHSCHHGSCGTCGALVEGKEALMCLTRLEALGPGPVLVEPLRKMGELGDLAVDPSPLFASLPPGSGYLRKSGLAHREPPLPGAEGGASGGAGGGVRFENCIECGLCVSVCPVTAPFVGPAALAAANRDREERPERAEAALAFAARPDGAWACERHLDCSRVCPMGVYPAKHIQLLRNALGKKV